MSRPFIYDEQTSILYDPYGKFIKHVFCPKAKLWNQLIADDSSGKTRFCETCTDRVINLDEIPPHESLAILEENPNTCIYAGKKSPNVIYLRSDGCFRTELNCVDFFYEESNKKDLQEIRISTDLSEINAAVNSGFFPDIVHSVSVCASNEVFRYYQDESGSVFFLSENNNHFDRDLKKVYSSELVAPPYLQFSIAAYLIPPGTNENQRFFIKNPIAVNKFSGPIEFWCVEGLIKSNKVQIDESTLRYEYVHIG